MPRRNKASHQHQQGKRVKRPRSWQPQPPQGRWQDALERLSSPKR